METGSSSIALAFAALVVALLSLSLAVMAYVRAGGGPRWSSLRTQRTVVHHLARTLRENLDESLTRVKRAQARLAEVGERGSENLHRSVDELSRQLHRLRVEAERELSQLQEEVPPRALAVQDALTRRIRHVEANIEIMRARSEITTAEELAEEGSFVEAEDMLEDARVRVREVKLRLSDVVGDDPAFGPVIDALSDAIHALRSQAQDHKRQLGTVLSASDSLLAWMKAHEPREPSPSALGS